MRIAINVYSVRELDATIEEVIDRVARAGYDGIQFSGGFSPLATDPEDVAEALADTDLDPTPIHVGMGSLQDDWNTVDEACTPLGVEGAVIPAVGGDHFDSRAAVDALAEQFETLATHLADRGWSLHYHNHSFEYEPMNGRTAFDRLIDRSTIEIELDVGWAEVGGDDPAARIRSLEDRLSLVHMKDVTADGEPCEIGEGVVDMEACAATAKTIDADWLIYEHDNPADPAASIDHGAAYLRSL